MSLIHAEKVPSIFDGTDNSIYGRGASMTKEEEKKLLHIVNDTPIEFEEIISKMTTTTTKLSMQINEVLHDLFSDYYGCEIIPNQMGSLDVTLIFKAIPVTEGDDKRAFLPISAQKDQTNNQTLNRMLTINAMNASRHRTMEITPYGMEMLYDIMTRDVKKKVNIKNVDTFQKYTGEVAEQTGLYSTVNNIYCTMTGIDLYRILDVVFGQKDSKGSRYIYKANPIRPVNVYAGTGGQRNWIVEIERMTVDAFNKLSAEIGMTPVPGAISAVTDTISSYKR